MHKVPYDRNDRVQIGTKKRSTRLWSTKIYGAKSTSFVIFVKRGKYVEYWLWGNTERTGKTYHGIIGSVSSMSRGYIHLTHKYYERSGSTSQYRRSIFDSIVLYKGTEVSFKLEPSSKAYVEKIVFKSETHPFHWLSLIHI